MAKPTAVPGSGDEPPFLEGFDLAEALKRLGLSWPVVRDLLLRSIPAQRPELEVLEAAAARGQADVVRLKAHSLAGVAANLGAKELTASARRLEEAARHDRPEEFSDLFKDLERRFTVVEASVARVAQGFPPPQDFASSSEKANANLGADDSSTLNGRWAALLTGLKEFNPVAAGEALAALERGSFPAELGPELAQIRRLVDDLAYDPAARMVRDILDRKPAARMVRDILDRKPGGGTAGRSE
jgi:HPt (histidine-containing phosphotransfer) domain-containing protein